ILVAVEVDVSSGLPHTTTVGLPDGAVREASDRIRAALRNAGLEYPTKRVTVNLAPAGVRKEGAAFDLPIALGILAADGRTSRPARRRRPRRRPRAGACAAGSRGGRGRGPQRAAHWAARLGQDHARPPPAVDPAAARAG